MNVSIITLVIFLLMQSVMICTAHAAASIGSDIKNIQKNGNMIGTYNTKSNISVIEYDTFGSETGHYIDDAFGMTTKYDKLGNVVSKYKTNQQGKTYLYDKYNHVVGYFKAVSKYKTMLYDKDGTPVGYFSTDGSGYVKKYDMDGNHLNTYKKR